MVNNQALETISDNIAAMAKESALLIERGQATVIREIIHEKVKEVSDYSIEDVTKLNKSISENYSKTFDYSKYIESTFYGTNTSYTAGLPVLYLTGDISEMSKSNKVHMDYKFGSNVREYKQGYCTCKWQGSSSINFPRKNYTIAGLTPKLDVGWGEQKKYCLKASYNDSSMALNVCSAKLWGQIVKGRNLSDAITTKLKTTPNGGAIDGFPIILVINDTYQGVYCMNIPKDAWMLGMGEGETEGFLCAEGGSDSEMLNAVHLKGLINKEKLLQDIGFSVGYVPNESDIDWIVEAANNAITAVMNSTGSSYKSGLADYINIYSFLDHYIFTALFNNADSIHKNWLFCTYDGRKFFCSAYDLDSSFGGNHIGTTFTTPLSNPFQNWSTINNIYDRIYNYDKVALKVRYMLLRDTVLSEANVATVFTNFMNAIPETLLHADHIVNPNRPNTSMEHLAHILNWYRLRCQVLDKFMESFA